MVNVEQSVLVGLIPNATLESIVLGALLTVAQNLQEVQAILEIRVTLRMS